MPERIAGIVGAVSQGKAALLVVAGVVLVTAVFYFRANVAKYWRRTGRAAEVAALNTLALIVTLCAVIALAWSLSTLFFGPGFWRNVLAVVLYSVLMTVAGSPLIAACTRFVERRYRL
jgi:hypothetical protein